MEGLKAALQSKGTVITVLTTTAVVGAGIAYLRWRRQRRQRTAYLRWRSQRQRNGQYVPVGQVSKIYVHPVKSCRGLEVGEAQVTKQGLKWEGVMDRHLLILDDKGRHLDGRMNPSIVLISPKCVGDGQVRLEAPGMDPLTLPGPKGRVLDVRVWTIDGDAVDCGPEAAAWLDKFFGKPGYKLVMSTPRSKKRHTIEHWRYKHYAEPDDKVGFQDQTALLVTSEASLDDLNKRLATPVDMRNFRPNIVVSGCEPFQEDDWLYMRIGQVEMRTVLPCNRCLMTTIDPETGVRDGKQEPLKTLRSYRINTEEKYKGLFGQTPLFGLKCAVDREGLINPGTVHSELLRDGFDRSGIYTIYPFSNDVQDSGRSIGVYCDMLTDGGGWTVFQRRQDGSQDFYRGWADYKAGFGKLDGEFWLGNDKIHQLTSQAQYELRIDLEDFEGNSAFAQYRDFHVSSEAENYNMTVGNYSGTAGDSMNHHSGREFSTEDRENDIHPTSCAQRFKGGWWYGECHSANLNGLYLGGSHTSYADGINWSAGKGYYYWLKHTEMKMRPIAN